MCRVHQGRMCVLTLNCPTTPFLRVARRPPCSWLGPLLPILSQAAPLRCQGDESVLLKYLLEIDTKVPPARPAPATVARGPTAGLGG
jgi:hypothetical protein